MIPYYGYARQDRKDKPRVPVTAKLVANLITTAGADRIMTMDLHAPQIQGFFNIPVDELTATHLLSNYWQQKELSNTVVVTDLGFAKRARTFAELVGAPLPGVAHQLLVGQGAQASDFPQNGARVTDGLHHVTGAGLALGADHGGAFSDTAKRLTQIPAAADKRNREGVLVDMVAFISRCQHFTFVYIVDADGL